MTRPLLLAPILLAACGGPGTTPDATSPDAPLTASEDWDRDVLDTRLAIDLTTRVSTATITLAPADSTGASFEIGDLEIASVTDADGEALPYEDLGAQLNVGVPRGSEPSELRIAYTFTYRGGFMGADDMPALTLTWPYYCQNLFPCKATRNTADGTRFALELSGVPDGVTAVYPTEIAEEAPPYMLAWTIGAYVERDVGTTTAGTQVKVWHTAPQEVAAINGTENLVAAFDWLEQTIGPYRFGDVVGTVSASWGPGAYGGMEHHPYWHVGNPALGDQGVNVHEAVHGWFGNGVRLRCWEDFVLSEGTSDYLAARALEVVGPKGLSDAIWAEYATSLQNLRDDNGGGVAWPASCGEVDILTIFNRSNAPYTKGAYFYAAVAERVGAAQLDAAIGAFYAEWSGKAAGMQDMLDTIQAETGWDPGACADAWLRAEQVPDVLTCE